MEETLILIKPDGVARSLTGNVLTELAKLDFEIVGAKVLRVNRSLAEKHYDNLKDTPFFRGVVRYVMGEFHRKDRVIAFVYRGENAIQRIRDLIGATDPNKADPITIRGKYGRIRVVDGVEIFENVVHASADAKDAEREISLWFAENEIVRSKESRRDAKARRTKAKAKKKAAKKKTTKAKKAKK
ncbi:MAG: nucleoside-diphosphate kinase [Planctomycetes bacterium]|nr:nucleoside-diphosphate kinase [Planctomycetota bacterium]